MKQYLATIAATHIMIVIANIIAIWYIEKTYGKFSVFNVLAIVVIIVFWVMVYLKLKIDQDDETKKIQIRT